MQPCTGRALLSAQRRVDAIDELDQPARIHHEHVVGRLRDDLRHHLGRRRRAVGLDHERPRNTRDVADAIGSWADLHGVLRGHDVSPGGACCAVAHTLSHNERGVLADLIAVFGYRPTTHSGRRLGRSDGARISRSTLALDVPTRSTARASLTRSASWQFRPHSWNIFPRRAWVVRAIASDRSAGGHSWCGMWLATLQL